MGVLLSILSVIGIVLLWILRIVLGLLLLVFLLLICPIRYRAHTVFGEEWSAEGRISYLLSAFSVKVVYRDGNLQSRIHLFGMDVLKILERWNSRKEKKRKKHMAKETQQKKQPSDSSQESNAGEIEMAESTTEHSGDNGAEEGEREYDKNTGAEESRIEHGTDAKAEESRLEHGTDAVEADLKTAELSEPDMEESAMPERKQTEKTAKDTFWRRTGRWHRFRQRVKEFWQKLCTGLKRIRQFFCAIPKWLQKWKHRAECVQAVRAFLKLDNTKHMVCIFKDNVLHLWRKLKPKVIKGEVLFGTGDPCSTGQILGVAAMVYAAYGKGVRVTPDFEEKRFEGNLLIKGRVNILTLLVIAIRIFFSSEWERFRRDMGQVKEAM